MPSIFTARSALLALSLTLVAACGKEPPYSAYYNRGGPEALLDVSSEVVNLSVASRTDRKDLSAWIEKDQPTRAELNCAVNNKICAEAEKILDLHGVPVSRGNGADQTVTLIYQRILARDCSQRYIDNTPNHYNAHHSAFGCSISANMVQQVTDKQEFVAPNLSDEPSAVGAINALRNANTPRDPAEAYDIQQSAVKDAKSN